ncbi:MAG TPA: hemolysin III family protein [Candidatus Dormibacteraeota bacterium]
MPKPLLRGYLHAIAAGLAVAGFIGLMQRSPGRLVARLPLIIYGSTLILLFSVSALYHLGRWRPGPRAWLRRLDHSNIFLLIAGTYTPLVGTALTGAFRLAILVVIWTLAVLGVVGAAPFLRIPRGVLTGLYVLMGWVVLVATPQLAATLGARAIILMGLGGVQYTAGAVVYGLQRPRLWPRVFGFHELFHLAVVTASATFYVLVLQYGIPRHV